MKSPHILAMPMKIALHLTMIGIASVAIFVDLALLHAAEPAVPALVGHWPLMQDTRDAVATLHGRPIREIIA